MRAAALVLALGAILPPAPSGAPAQEPGPALERAQTLEPDFEVADLRLADLDSDGAAELLVLGRAGEVRTFGCREGARTLDPEPLGELGLPRPGRSLVALGDPAGAGRPRLVVADSAGLWECAPGRDGALGEARRIGRRPRFPLRTGEPTFARILQDVNRDGRLDLVIPTADRVELWLNRAEAEAEWALSLAASIPVEVDRNESRDTGALSFMLRSSFSVPDLQTRDVDGDVDPDIVVVDGRRRAFHLQRQDGSYAPEPDVEVDLSIFQDTTEPGRSRPGHTMVLTDDATFHSADLDGDGIPDYVIAQGRKVWVFHGGASGPQFEEPSSILKAAEDVTALAIADLNLDGSPDLLLLKVQVPSVAMLVRGVLGDWDIEVIALGYENEGDRTFSRTPTRRGELALRLPPLLRILRRPDRFLKRFEEIGQRYRITAEADLDGNGVSDQILAAEDLSALQFWLGREGDPGPEEGYKGLLRWLFFEDPDRTWDLDRVVMAMGDLAQRRLAHLTGEREAAGRLELRDPAEWRLEALHAGDVDGDGRDEVLAAYRAADGEARDRVALDLLRVR